MGDIQKIKEFIEENVKKGFIRPLWFPQTVLVTQIEDNMRALGVNPLSQPYWPLKDEKCKSSKS